MNKGYVKSNPTTMNHAYQPQTREALIDLLCDLIPLRGLEGNYNDIDVSQVTSFYQLFSTASALHEELNVGHFNGDISKWDVSSGVDFGWMFHGNQKFQGDLSNWDMSSAKNLYSMFFGSIFDGDISRWNLSNAKNMEGMFAASSFNHDLSKWDVSGVTNMKNMFLRSAFNQDISAWDVGNVLTMRFMFFQSKFQQNVAPWCFHPSLDRSTIFAESAYENVHAIKMGDTEAVLSHMRKEWLENHLDHKKEGISGGKKGYKGNHE